MKKTRMILGAVLIAGLLLLSACGQKTAGKSDTFARADGTIDPDTHATYHDGDFSAHSAYFDADGHGQMLTVSVRSGIITRVVFTERDQTGNDLTATAYTAAKNKNLATRDDVYEILENRLIRRQNPSDVKAVRGAAAISSDFVALAKAALRNSRQNKNAGASVSVNINSKNKTERVLFNP